MDEKMLMNVVLYAEKNFNGIERAFKGVSHGMKKHTRAINKICMLSGMGFLCTVALFSIQSKQIIALQNQVRRLEGAKGSGEEGEADAEK